MDLLDVAFQSVLGGKLLITEAALCDLTVAVLMGGQNMFVQVYHLFATDAAPILQQAFILLDLDDLLVNQIAANAFFCQMFLPIGVIFPDLIVRQEHFIPDVLIFQIHEKGTLSCQHVCQASMLGLIDQKRPIYISIPNKIL